MAGYFYKLVRVGILSIVTRAYDLDIAEAYSYIVLVRRGFDQRKGPIGLSCIDIHARNRRHCCVILE